LLFLSGLKYTAVVFLLILLEAGITADVFLNRNWEEVVLISLAILHDPFYFSMLYLWLSKWLLHPSLGFSRWSFRKVQWVRGFCEIKFWNVQMDLLVYCHCAGISYVCMNHATRSIKLCYFDTQFSLYIIIKTFCTLFNSIEQDK